MRKNAISRYFGEVWDAIPTDHFVSTAVIAEELGVKNNTVRRLVKGMRESGLAIVTDLHYGYKKAVTDEEIWLCIRELEDRISALQDTVSTLKRLTTEKAE